MTLVLELPAFVEAALADLRRLYPEVAGDAKNTTSTSTPEERVQQFQAWVDSHDRPAARCRSLPRTANTSTLTMMPHYLNYLTRSMVRTGLPTAAPPDVLPRGHKHLGATGPKECAGTCCRGGGHDQTLTRWGEPARLRPPVLVEFWSVATRPNALPSNGLGMTPQEAEVEFQQALAFFRCCLIHQQFSTPGKRPTFPALSRRPCR